jgi:hypothetical protein
MPDQRQTTDHPPWLVWWFTGGMILTGMSGLGMLIAMPFGPLWTKVVTIGGFAVGTGSVALSLLKGEDYAGGRMSAETTDAG